VVRLEGMIPPMAMKGDRFDVRVSPIAGSDTISLRGGRLYRAELKPPGTFGVDARPLGTADGPVFVDGLGTAQPALKTGYVLGGGRVAYDYTGIIHLRRSDFVMASSIRNRLNERYGPDTATAISGTDVAFKIPLEYRLRKDRFIKLLGATYLAATADLAAARTDAGLRGLADANDKEASEIALEALGRDSIAGLAPLLNSPNDEIRLRAARCMLYLHDQHDDRAVETLYAIATDSKSSRRVEAMEAIASGAQRDDARSIIRRLLSDSDEQVIRAAFEHLRRLGDPAVREEFINQDFYLDQVPLAGRRVILVSRSGDPRIVLLGSPLICRDNTSIESPGGIVTVTAQPGQNTVLLTWKSSSRRTPAPSARSSPMIGDIVRTLGADPTGGPQRQPAGLGVSYAEITALLERMCAEHAINAEFWAGPLAKFQQTVKK
jgi:hypothetical protein